MSGAPVKGRGVPTKGRGPWHNNSMVPMDGMTPLGLALLDLISELAREGAAMPSSVALGQQLGCSDVTLSRLLTIFERDGVLIIEKRGRAFSLQRRVTIVATGETTGEMADRVQTQRQVERMTYTPHPVPPGPPVREEAKVWRTRCPFCNLPPDHAECRHGWNGLTTHSQRRAIGAEAARIAA